MKPWMKGLMIALIQVLLVASLGGRLLYDRAALPRVWVRTARYDPRMPIRGRYLALNLVVEPQGFEAGKDGKVQTTWVPVTLKVEGTSLVAEKKTGRAADTWSGLHIRPLTAAKDEKLMVLDKPVLFFIPEDASDPSDPSNLKPGEQLWAEVSVPPEGLPRPIRLGVKKGDGPIQPLAAK